MTKNDWISSEICGSKEDFAKISFRFSKSGEGRSPYLFRGLSDEKYPLVPSLFQDGFFEKCEEKHLQISTREELQEEEARLLLDFYRKCDREALYLPDIPSVRQNALGNLFSYDTLMDISHRDSYYWLPGQVFELAGLAQHYGVRTRVMDWTRNFLVAVWFALNQTGKEKGKDAAVWAIDAEGLQDWQHQQEEAIRQSSPFIAHRLDNEDHGNLSDDLLFECYEDTLPLRFIVPPYHGNQNLYAQQGVLSMWRENMIRGTAEGGIKDIRVRISDAVRAYRDSPLDDERKPLDERLVEYLNRTEAKNAKDSIGVSYQRHRPVMIEIVLKQNVFDDLHALLEFLNVNRMMLIPGYQEIAMDVSR